MFWTAKFWMICCWQLSLVLADDIDMEYFFGSSYEALREPARDALDCKNPVNQVHCKVKCKNDVGVCFQKKCFCVYELKQELPKMTAIITDVDYADRDDVILRYSLGRRHHIAHFCPNLKEARKCIRKCMKEGKPAFCGKDHICYCGHRYSHNQKEEKLDPAKINAGFYELYEKYFGPNTTVMNQNASEKHGVKDSFKNEVVEEKGGKKNKGNEKIPKEEAEEGVEEKPVEDTPAEEGEPEDGATGEEAADDKSAEEGVAEEGATEEGAADKGAAEEGAEEEGAAAEGAAEEGATGEAG